MTQSEKINRLIELTQVTKDLTKAELNTVLCSILIAMEEDNPSKDIKPFLLKMVEKVKKE